MKNKVFLILVLFIILVKTSSAQFIANFGYSNSIYKHGIKNSDFKKGALLNGINVGLLYNIQVYKGFSIETGIEYSFLYDNYDSIITFYHGSDIEWKSSANNKLKENYLDIPVYLKYTQKLTDNLKVSIFGGAKFILGLSSKTKFKYRGKNERGVPSHADFSKNLYTDESDYGVHTFWDSGLIFEMFYKALWSNYFHELKSSKFDIQLGIGTDIMLYDKIFLKVSYNWGLMPIFEMTEARYSYVTPIKEPYSLKRNQFNLSIGYKF
ncbi:PorT family protein [Bacteroidales bacterium OttesenSCG-928-I21]|nr:PorT family protein [Bacteroidales bacterium OttesenSCG-928-I21]